MTSVPAAAIDGAGLAHALHEAEHQLHSRFERSPLAMIESDTAFRVTGWNQAATRLFGYASRDVIGQPISCLAAGAGRSLMEAFWRERVLEAPTEFNQENVDRDGQRRMCRWHNAPITTANGSVVGVCSTVLDLSERGYFEEAAVRAYRMEALSRVADGVAHDFTNVLAVILSYANFIKDSSAVGDARRDDALEILTAAGEGTALVRHLLGISARTTAEKPIELNESLSQLRGLLVRSLGEYRELHLIKTGTSLLVRIDPVRFDQLVLTLALAAADSVPNAGGIQITLEERAESGATAPAQRCARMTLAATDAGLTSTLRPAEPRPPPRPLARSLPDLANCASVVEAAGGQLAVQGSESLGPTFVVDLPLFLEALGAVEGALVPAQRCRVLIAESEPALRRAAARALERAGYEVEVALDHEEALTVLAKLGAELGVLITDLSMPGCENGELVTAARSRAPDAAMLTTSVFELGEASLPLSDVVRVYKPFAPNELVLAVGEARSRERAAAGEQPARGSLVLLIEDDDAMRAALARMLECAGYSVCHAESLAAARARLASTEPALVLCDLSLPDGSSAELLDGLLIDRPSLRGRVFVLTGGAVGDADVAFLRRGLVPALRKPIDPGSLLRLVAAALSGSEAGA